MEAVLGQQRAHLSESLTQTGRRKAGAGRIPFVAERGEEIIATFISLFKDAFNIPGVQGVSIV